MARRRVVVTGMGAVTPIGHSVKDLFSSCLEGKSGMGPIFRFDASTFPTKFASQVKDFDLPGQMGEVDRWIEIGLNSRFALGACKQALIDAGLFQQSKVDSTDIGIYLGSGEGSQEFHSLVDCTAKAATSDGFKVDQKMFFEEALKCFHPTREYEIEMHTTAAHLAQEFNLEGPNLSCLTACAASAQAIGEAVELIRRGEVPIMLGGGAHSMIHPCGVTGFNRLTALSTRNDNPQKASRPFDKDRDGFVLGEGAGIVVLEELEHAKARGATIYAEMTGYGTTCDAFRVTDPHENGRGAAACMRMAIANAGLNTSDIGYINAHGTSTSANDHAETLAVKTVFGEYAYRLPISSSKSMLGHLIAAGGVVELIISIQAMRNGVLPPTMNYETPDPDCDLDYIPNEPRAAKVQHILSNSFGFGGQNISLVASRF
jgi:3-oxoacyl-[acyl-carrier-protein] synthase II